MKAKRSTAIALHGGDLWHVCGRGKVANKPIIEVIGEGKLAYIRIGNDAPDDMGCYATLEGSGLRKLAAAITAAVGK